MNEISPPLGTVYRFRSADALLDGFHELDKQQIFLAPPDQLNDPMEGYQDVFWLGDRILWVNLLRHYVFCFVETALFSLLLSDDDGTFHTPEIPVLRTEDELATAQLRALHHEIMTKVLEQAATRRRIEDSPRPAVPFDSAEKD